MTSIDVQPRIIVPNRCASRRCVSFFPQVRRRKQRRQCSANRLGMIREVVDATGVQDHIEYVFSQPETDTATTLYVEMGSGLVFAQTRCLIETAGQWMQEDPIGFMPDDGDLHRYVTTPNDA
jgi:hypothetical protein